MARSFLSVALFAGVAVATTGCPAKDQATGGQPSTQTTSSAQTSSGSAAPAGIVYAASNQVRVIDVASRRVVAEIPLGRAVREIRFAPDAPRAYLATSRGIHVVDTRTHRIVDVQLDVPVRSIDLAGDRLFALWHRVDVRDDGTRDIRPFSVSVFERPSLRSLRTVEIGQRIHRAFLADDNERYSFVATERGDLHIGPGFESLEALSGRVEIGDGESGPSRLRHEIVRRGDRIFVPVEGHPARVVIFDRRTGASRTVRLPEATSLRGLDATVDGGTVVVNAVRELFVIDAERGAVRRRVPLSVPHQAVAVHPAGEWAVLAQLVDQTGGAVRLIDLFGDTPPAKIVLGDISPWTLGARGEAEAR